LVGVADHPFRGFLVRNLAERIVLAGAVPAAVHGEQVMQIGAHWIALFKERLRHRVFSVKRARVALVAVARERPHEAAINIDDGVGVVVDDVVHGEPRLDIGECPVTPVVEIFAKPRPQGFALKSRRGSLSGGGDARP